MRLQERECMRICLSLCMCGDMPMYVQMCVSVVFMYYVVREVTDNTLHTCVMCYYTFLVSSGITNLCVIIKTLT